MDMDTLLETFFPQNIGWGVELNSFMPHIPATTATTAINTYCFIIEN